MFVDALPRVGVCREVINLEEEFQLLTVTVLTDVDDVQDTEVVVLVGAEVLGVLATSLTWRLALRANLVHPEEAHANSQERFLEIIRNLTVQKMERNSGDIWIVEQNSRGSLIGAEFPETIPPPQS
jgi:hypothetical protein